MHTSRLRIYDELRSHVGDTPLYEIRKIPIPNGNRIFAKEEYRNGLTGSHYDRVYIDLLQDLEEREKIAPNRVHLLETTSGNAGTAFAAVAKALGYESTVIIPEGVSGTRLAAIRGCGAEVVQTPVDLFVAGAVAALRRKLFVENRSRIRRGAKPYYCPNHSQSPKALESMGRLVDELLTQMPVPLDCFVAAAGNGLSILGPGRELKRRGARIVAWDPVQAPRAFEMKYPGRYAALFGIAPGALGQHHIYGTGVLGVEFPFLQEAVCGGTRDPLVDEVMLVTDREGRQHMADLVEQRRVDREALDRVELLPDLESAHHQLLDVEQRSVGLSSAGSFALALRLSEEVENKAFLIIFYDAGRFYNGS